MPEFVRYALRAGPLTPRHMHVHRFRGREAMSELYAFEVDVHAAVPESLFERAALGRTARFALRIADRVRLVHGVVAALRVQARVEGRSVQRDAISYRLRVVPRAFLARRVKQSRIFQDLPVDVVIDTVLRDHGIRSRFVLEEKLPPRAYLTQYEETDYAFVKRLAAENGLLFYFDQPPFADDELLAPAGDADPLVPLTNPEIDAWLANGGDAGPREAMVFTDQAQYPAIAESDALRYRSAGALVGGEDDFVLDAGLRRSARPVSAVYRDYDPRRPLAALEVASKVDPWEPNDPGYLETYAHDGNDLFVDWKRAERETTRILRQERRRARLLEGTSVCARVEAGHTFTLEDHPAESLNRAWVAVGVEHEGAAGFGEGGGEPAYQNRFVAAPAEVVYLPKRPKRRSVQVCQTAVVVGPEGDDIHVNERGEIKVRFFWDRRNGLSDPTCWIRTMHPWAGAGWGAQFIPRVGREVTDRTRSREAKPPDARRRASA